VLRRPITATRTQIAPTHPVRSTALAILDIQETVSIARVGCDVKCIRTPIFQQFDRVMTSGESRIIFLPERCSICQYRPKISAINVKNLSRGRLLLAHPILYILKAQKKCAHSENHHFKINQKALYATDANLRYLRMWFRQCNLSCLNLTPHTIAYLLILCLQSTYPKIANLILILYIVCSALGCF